MKRTYLFWATACLCNILHAQEKFSFTGEFPGLTEGAKVTLYNNETRQNAPDYVLAQGKVTNGKILLEGSTKRPVLATLSVDLALQADNENSRIPTAVAGLMLDNSAYLIVPDTVSPLSPLADETAKNRLRIDVRSDNKVHRNYVAYIEEITPYRMDYERELARRWKVRQEADEAQMSRFEVLIDRSKARLDSAEMAYMARHTGEALAIHLAAKHIDGLFKYTPEQLEHIRQQAGTCTDSVRNAQLEQALTRAHRYAIGMPYTDFTIKSPEGVNCALSSVVRTDRPVLIDIWASWCRPCRAEIPKIRKQLYNKYGDKLQIISISIDKKEDDWKKALAEDQMEWSQWTASPSQMDLLSKAYGLQFIPYMIVIQNGKIQGHGHTKDLAPLIEKLME